MGDRFELVDVGVDGDDGPIIDSFSARIPADGLTAVVGPSGAGKSTVLRLLNRLDDPDRGAVLLDGVDLRDLDVLALRRRVQLVGQVPVMFPGTVGANIATAVAGAPGAGAAVDGPGSGGAGRDRAARLLERVGLDGSLLDRDADVLSIGQAQRVALARALARQPEVLLLDEPTSALDTGSKAGIEALVRSLADEGLTVVLITHDPAQAGTLADHVLPVRPRHQ